MKIGSLCYSTFQGLGYLARSFHAAGVVNSVFVVEHPSYVTQRDWYPGAPSTPLRRPNMDAVRNWASGLDILVCWETPFFWELPGFCRQRGVKTALCVMHEWFPERPPGKFDLYLCPSLLDLDIFKNIGRAEFVPIPVDPSTWKLRTKAERFLHNAGHLGSRLHKGTEELLKAVPLSKSPFTLTIRSQTSALRKLLAAYPKAARDPRVRVEIGDRPYETLFDDHDCLIAPEKYNGLSLPLQESRAAGLLVLTTDRYPANTWLPKQGLIPPDRYHKVRVAPGYLEIDEAVVNPQTVADAIDAAYGTDITAYSEAGREWAAMHSWEALRGRYLAALESLL